MESVNTSAAPLSNNRRAGETFILVHGAWHGGWCWRKLQAQLLKAGHTSHAPTLSGLADKAGLMSDQLGLTTHIRDIIEFVEVNELNDFYLLGHSYSGMVISGVAEQISDKIEGLIYLDAIVPQDQDSLISSGIPNDPAVIKAVEEQVRAMSEDGVTIAPPSADSFGIPKSDTVDLEWVDSLLTPHPLKTWFEPLEIKNPAVKKIPKMFLHCTKPEHESNIGAVAARIKAEEEWVFVEMQTGHNAMITQPKILANLIEDFALDKSVSYSAS